MATAGVINVFLNANVSGFKKGLDQSRSVLSGFVGSATTLLSSATSTLQGWVDEVGDSIAPVNDLANRIGASAESLMGLEHAAETSGVSVGVFRKGLERMSKRLGDVQREMSGTGTLTAEVSDGIAEISSGSGPAAKALDTLGMSIQDIEGANPTEQFRKIAQAISELDSQSEKLSVTQNLFGASGRSLLNLLDEGEEGISSMIAEAKELGITLENQDVSNIANMSTALSKVGSSLTSVKQSLVAELAPAITAAADLFTEWSTSALSSVGGVRGIIRQVGDAALWMIDRMAVLKPIGQDVWATITEGAALYWEFLESIGKSTEELINLIPGVEVEFASGLSAVAEEARRTAEANRKAAEDAFEAWADPDNSPSESIRAWLSGVQSSAEETSDVLDSLAIDAEAVEDARKDLAKRAESVFAATRTPMERFQEEMKELRELLSEGLIDRDVFDRAVDAAEKSINDRLGTMKTDLNDVLDFSKAMELGSTEAFSAINRHRLDRGRDDEGVKVAREQLNEQRDLRKDVQELISVTRNNSTQLLDV